MNDPRLSGASRNPVTDNLDLWSSALLVRSTAGRGNNGRLEAYGIKRLRELILELAVRGKLLPQVSGDEPTSLLLKRIADERNQLAKEGKIKKPKKLAGISDDEKPFSLPNGWDYVRLNDIGEWGAGITPPRGRSEFYGGEIPWFKSGELVGDYISRSEECLTELALKETSLKINKPGDVLVAMYGATIGKTSILEVAATTNQAVCACTPFSGFVNTFLLTLLKAYRGRFVEQGAGGAQPNISREKIIATVIALPPTDEQYRIVAKVDELMALCNQLEQQQGLGIEAHQTLVETLLGTLTNVESAQEFAAAWNRIAENFDTLFTTEHSIDQFKRAILQIALMGKLFTFSQPAEMLTLESCLAEDSFNGVSKSPTSDRNATEILRISAGTSRDDFYVDEEDFKHVDLSDSEVQKFVLQEGDLLACRFNGNLHYVGRFSFYRRQSGRKQVNPDKLIRFRVNINRHCSRYICYAMNSDSTRKAIEAMCSTTAGNIGLNAGKLKSVKIPAPTLEDQRLIVAKVEELMALCDALKARLAEAQATQIRLADAIVELAVAEPEFSAT